MTNQTIHIGLTLDSETLRWVNQVAFASNRTVSTVISDYLTILGSPASQEDELIDKLLASAINYLPAIMELDEQTEMRDEVIDHLCTRLLEVAANSKVSLTGQEFAQLREKLVSQSERSWSAQ